MAELMKGNTTNTIGQCDFKSPDLPKCKFVDGKIEILLREKASKGKKANDSLAASLLSKGVILVAGVAIGWMMGSGRSSGFLKQEL